MLSNNIELYYWKKRMLVAGIDEVGRGCLAGPVVAAAVVLPPFYVDEIGLNDSKLLSHSSREQIFQKLIDFQLSYSIGIVDNFQIDKINILNATMQAMNYGIEQLKVKPNHLLIDGNYFKGNSIPHTTIIKGDSKCLSIAAASIIAKVTRDRLMVEYNKFYPYWNFEQNKGYGTKKHIYSIEKYNICNIHRRTFLKSYLNNKSLKLQLFNNDI